MPRDEKGLGSLIKRIDRLVDQGADEEVDMKDAGRRLFGRSLDLTGRVKFKMEPMRKVEKDGQ